MKKEPERVEMDLQKIFLTPPNTMKEKITLVIMMVVVFVMFFGPVTFTEISRKRDYFISISRPYNFLGLDGAFKKPVSEEGIL